MPTAKMKKLLKFVGYLPSIVSMIVGIGLGIAVIFVHLNDTTVVGMIGVVLGLLRLDDADR